MRSLATARDTVPRLMPSVAASPSDVWREGCWRFVVYPGSTRGRPVDIVFAFYLQSRSPAIRSAVLDADTDEVIGPPGPRVCRYLGDSTDFLRVSNGRVDPVMARRA
jgi:hypothetical protein